MSGNSGHNDNIKTDMAVLETAAWVKYLRMTQTSQNYSHDEIKSQI